MSKLADAQLAADGKAEQDKDRELRVAEMENAIERAMDARRAAQRSGAFKSGGSGESPGSPSSSEAQMWASKAQGRQAQAQASEELADAHARAHMVGSISQICALLRFTPLRISSICFSRRPWSCSSRALTMA